jgi:hypothetical protein
MGGMVGNFFYFLGLFKVGRTTEKKPFASLGWEHDFAEYVRLYEASLSVQSTTLIHVEPHTWDLPAVIS